jgi:hypothetical protein
VRVEILDTQRPQQWRSELSTLDGSDVYFLPEYHHAYELNADGQARAFVASNNADKLFYPFLLRKIERVGAVPLEEELYDIETVYGYSGPLCSTSNPAFLEAAWAEYSAWCRDQGVIAEFIRFNPLSANQAFAGTECQVGFNRETVVLRLDLPGSLMEGYSSIHRNMIRKAMRGGLTCGQATLAGGMENFKRLYFDTMRRTEADAYYFFSEEYFAALVDTPELNVALFEVTAEEKPVASALFLLHGDRIHYHLAGSDAGFRHLAPNNLLLHTVAEWGRAQGFRWLHLGGGRTPSSEDSLFKFKSTISKSRLPFYTGKRIHDPQNYESLCSQAMINNGGSRGRGYFLLYRL